MTYSKVYIFDDEKGLAESTRCLLESCDFKVDILKEGAFSLNLPIMNHEDIVVIHLRDEDPDGFKLLNNLIFRHNRPNIVLTTELSSALSAADYFPGDRVRVLTQPVKPNDLVEAVRLH